MKVIIIVSLLLAFLNVDAQQKKKVLKLLEQQIAANKVYIDYLEKGYSIAQNGLEVIHKIKKGDFDLHFNFFDSLKKVNPQLKSWTKVADIISYQLRIIKVISQTLLDIKETNQFNNDELNYCKAVFDNLLTECLKNIDELVMVTTNGRLTMKDDERMKRIDNLYNDMQDKYSFTASFSEEMGMLSAQRLSEDVEINISKKINWQQ